MKLQDLLTEQEIAKYNEEWKNFRDKYTLNTPYNVHSGVPVIGRVFQFQDKPLFRAHIFKRRLRKFDPYFISSGGYVHPFFHSIHYFFPIEQLYHASMHKLLEDYYIFITTDIFDRQNPVQMKKPIDFEKTRVSIEIVLDFKKGTTRFTTNGLFTFYDDRANEQLQIWPLKGFGNFRRYIKCIRRLQQGDETALQDLIRKIEGQNRNHKQMINPRKNLQVTADFLINELRESRIPEQELHDFFSFWDRE